MQNENARDKKLKFPAGFLWGAGTSSHQVEGGNINNDWHEWEQKGKTKEKSGIACDYWNRFSEDHAIARELDLNAFRISLEWSRIEPEEGKFSEEAMEHYRQILEDMKGRGLKRIVTLNHYTLPAWFSHKIGWHKKESSQYFAKYSEKVIQKLGDEIDLVVTINEPRLVINRGYLTGDYPPGKRMRPILFLKARKNLAEAHRKSYDIIKKIRPELPVGITQFTNDFDYFGKGRWENWLTEKIEDFYNWHFFDEIGDKQDFIGINYYYGAKVKLTYPFFELATYEKKVTDMGWGIMPEGIYEVIMDAWKKYKKPIYILENGIADQADKYRTEFIKGHLRAVHKAIRKGADVRGYFHWSLVDNFEWNSGYAMKFGLCEVDRQTLERRIRPSAREYARICKSNEFEI